MKSFPLFVLIGIVMFIGQAQADCGDAATPDDGEVKQWFKNLGCTIKKGAEDVGEAAKPWADKIGTSAKDFGSSVAQKYDEIKHKITDDSASTATPLAGLHDGPTEKIPLAPLTGSDASVGAAGFASAPAVAPAATTGEQRTTESTVASSTVVVSSTIVSQSIVSTTVVPESVVAMTLGPNKVVSSSVVSQSVESTTVGASTVVVPTTNKTTTEKAPIITPESIDDRFLLQPRECPVGQALDHLKHCRPAA